MRFWRENKQFDVPVSEVAEKFAYAVANDTGWRDKFRRPPLEPVLRDWLTSPLGLNFVWWETDTGPESFEEVLAAARELTAPKRRTWVTADIQQQVLLSQTGVPGEGVKDLEG